MQYTAKEQAAALSAIFQAAGLVERLAKSGQISEEPLEPLIGSLFVISPDRVEDVFNGYDSLLTGRKILNDVLQRQADAIRPTPFVMP